MKFSKTLLLVSAAMFISVGVPFLLSPEQMASRLNLIVNSGLAAAEIRSMYGGVEIGFGLFLLVSMWKESTVRPAVLALICMLTGLILGRGMGISLDGASDVITWLFLLTEVIWLGVALNAWIFDRPAKA